MFETKQAALNLPNAARNGEGCVDCSFSESFYSVIRSVTRAACLSFAPLRKRRRSARITAV